MVTLQPHELWPTRFLCPWEFSRQEYWSGLPCPPPGDLPNPGIKPTSPALQVDSLPLSHQGSPRILEWVAYPLTKGSSQPRNWIEPGLLHCRQILYQLSYRGSPNDNYQFLNIHFVPRPIPDILMLSLTHVFTTNWERRTFPSPSHLSLFQFVSPLSPFLLFSFPPVLSIPSFPLTFFCSPFSLPSCFLPSFFFLPQLRLPRLWEVELFDHGHSYTITELWLEPRCVWFQNPYTLPCIPWKI